MTAGALSGLLEKNRESKTTLAAYTGGDTTLAALVQERDEAQEMQDALRGWLLDPRNAVNLVTYIESVSDQVGLNSTIEKLNTQKVVSVDGYESSAFELIVELEGTFDETQQFLVLMENIPYESRLEDVNIQRLGLDQWKIMVQMIVYTNPQI